jgi:DNA-binding IclR family transcriptional regulator
MYQWYTTAMSRQRAFHELRGIQSIEIGCRLLTALTQADRPLGLGELAKAGAMSPSKARRYLISFARSGLVEQDAVSGHYDLGAFAMRLGLVAQSRSDVVRLSRPLLMQLRDRLRETVAVVVWVGGRPTVVHIEESDRTIIRVVAPVGSQLALLTTAGGMIFAAFLPADVTAPLIEQELRENARQPRQPNLVRTRREADLLLSGIRKRGLARAHPVISTTICTLAAPVFDARGAIAAALVALGYRSTFDASFDGPVAKALQAAAAQLSQRLGHAVANTGNDKQGSGRGKDRDAA